MGADPAVGSEFNPLPMAHGCIGFELNNQLLLTIDKPAFSSGLVNGFRRTDAIQHDNDSGFEGFFGVVESDQLCTFGSKSLRC